MTSKGVSAKGGRAAFVVGSLIFAVGLALGQMIIENPARPLAKNAGRVLVLTEVWRITDDSGGFYFKYPRDLKIADDGSIFLRDIDQFLKFTPDGKFLKNIYKKGQGPGEMKDGAYQYEIRGQDLYILDRNARRFWRADLEGVFQEQYDLTGVLDPQFIGIIPEGFLFLTFAWPPHSEFTGKTVTIPHRLVLVGRDGRTIKDVFTFGRQAFLAPHAAMSDMLLLIPDAEGQAVYMFNGWDYRIDVLEPLSGQKVMSMSRVYPKFRVSLTDEQEKQRRESGMPRYEFAPDINNFYPVKDGVWVETSTDDKDKGRLYDVFDKDGRFIDSFYLGPGKTLMAVHDDALFCLEKGENETISIAKYRVEK